MTIQVLFLQSFDLNTPLGNGVIYVIGSDKFMIVYHLSKIFVISVVAQKHNLFCFVNENHMMMRLNRMPRSCFGIDMSDKTKLLYCY